jgi:hypothetical protein
MRSSKSFVVGLSIVAAVVAAVPLAHAGGGMGGGSLADVTAPMACRLILNAANQSQTIKIVDGFTSEDNVKVGAAVLLCQTGLASLVSGPPTAALPSTVTPDSITCYNLGNADQLKQPVTFTDAFGEQQATLGGISVFCVPALFGTVPSTP